MRNDVTKPVILADAIRREFEAKAPPWAAADAPFCVQHLKDPACKGRAATVAECEHTPALCTACVCWPCAYGPLTEKEIGRVGRDDLIARLLHAQRESARLQKDHDTMLHTCASAQARGTQLTDQVRALRSVLHTKASVIKTIEPGLLQVLSDIATEHYRAECKHGVVTTFVETPDGTGSMEFYEEAESAKAKCDRARAAGTLTWAHILIEEAFEALAESEPAKLRAELLQVANVAAMWIEVLDLREGEPT